jgi:hypothetical protein
MVGAGIYNSKPEWRKSLIWHLKQFFYSRRVWKKTKQDKHIDLLSFHCWRVERLRLAYNVVNVKI